MGARLVLATTCIALCAHAQKQTVPAENWKMVPRQAIRSSFRKNFSYLHDKGFLMSLSLGPQWNQSFVNPPTKGVRFGGEASFGGIVAHNLAFHVGTWGHFLEDSSLIAGGPGITGFFGRSNWNLGFNMGVGYSFSIWKNRAEEFNAPVLACEARGGKLWWLARNNSLGLSLASGVYGLALVPDKKSFDKFGWHVGLRLNYILN